MNSSILFIAPEFFIFHEQIQRAMESLGHRVHFVSDRPSKNAFVKILIRKARLALIPLLNSYFRRQTAKIRPDSVHEIFIIRGEGLTAKALREMKDRFQHARIQLYLWDNLRRSQGCKELIPVVDRAWTYDLKDSSKYPKLKFTPNFFVLSDNLKNLKSPKDSFQWDLVFFGTAHGDRLKVISKIARALPSPERFYVFLYFQSLILYWARRIFDFSFKNFRADQLSLKPKFGKDWEDIISNASAVLDIHHSQQGGLTIRTLESLALGFKLVTTDASITQYPFFNAEQILVVNRENPEIPSDFLRKPNNFPVHPSLKELELSNWIKRFFD